MTPQADHQLGLPLGGEPPRLIRTTRRANRKRPPKREQFCLFDRIPTPRPRAEVRYKRRYSLEVIKDADHPVDIEMGGYTHEQHVKNRAARVLAGTFEPTDTVPATRAECPAERYQSGCPHVRCRFHLWRIDGGIDGNRAGRPGLGLVPRNEKGLTVRFPGDAGGDRPPTTLLPRWLEPGPIAPSCALDEIDKHGKLTNEQAGHALARHRTLVARELKGGTIRAIEVGEEMGIEAGDLMRALMRMGDGPRES